MSCQSLVASPALATRLPPNADVAQLAELPTLALGTEQRECQWRLDGPDGARLSVPFTPRLVTDDMLALKQATLRGVGVAALPLMMIRDELDAGTLVPVGAPWVPEPGAVHAVFPSRRGLLPAVRELLDFMAAEYGETAPARMRYAAAPWHYWPQIPRNLPSIAHPIVR
ncbi:LysR substrate binding domain protein [compost metagenome]